MSSSAAPVVIPLPELSTSTVPSNYTQALISGESAELPRDVTQSRHDEEKGAKAWLAVLGSFFFLFASYGE